MFLISIKVIKVNCTGKTFNVIICLYSNPVPGNATIWFKHMQHLSIQLFLLAHI